MRYLKTYKIFESSDNIKQVIKDILLPISDMGYEISVNGDDSELVIRVVLWTSEPLLVTDEVKDEFIRMKDYLQSEGYNSIITHYYISTKELSDLGHTVTTNRQSIKEFDDFININSITSHLPLSNLLFVAKKTQ